MKLQVSFNLPSLEKAIALAHSIEQYTDIFEIGTVLLYKYGIAAVKEFKQQFPEKALLIDTKIIDKAKESIALFEHIGIYALTIMAGTTKDIIQSASTYAQTMHIKPILDLRDTHSLGQSALDAHACNVSGLILHNVQGETEGTALTDKWDMVRGNTSIPIFVSGSLTRETISLIHTLKPDGIIVGSAILKAADPEAEAAYFYQECQKL